MVLILCIQSLCVIIIYCIVNQKRQTYVPINELNILILRNTAQHRREEVIYVLYSRQQQREHKMYGFIAI